MQPTGFFKKILDQHGSRVLENFEPSEHMTKIIKKFGRIPKVSIDEAIEPLKTIVKDVDLMLKQVKENSNERKDGLTLDESASILLYTMEWESKHTSLYAILNKTLRSEDRELIKPWHLYLKLFMTALENLKPLSMTVYRGMKRNLSEQYPKGRKFTWPNFSSCTRSVEVLQSEQFLGKTGQRTLFSIHCESGRDIKNHSFFPTEDEVLLLAGRKFEVMSCLDSGNDLFIIQLKEIETDRPLLNVFDDGDDENEEQTVNPFIMVNSVLKDLPEILPPRNILPPQLRFPF